MTILNEIENTSSPQPVEAKPVEQNSMYLEPPKMFILPTQDELCEAISQSIAQQLLPKMSKGLRRLSISVTDSYNIIN